MTSSRHGEQEESRGASATAHETTMTAGYMTEKEAKKLKKAELLAKLEKNNLSCRGNKEELLER